MLEYMLKTDPICKKVAQGEDINLNRARAMSAGGDTIKKLQENVSLRTCDIR